jgi:hypothetical protein
MSVGPVHRWRTYAIMMTERNSVGIKAFFVYWQKDGPGTPHTRISKPITSYQRALDQMFAHAKENGMSREIQPNPDHQWGASHEAIIFLQNQGFEQQINGAWKKPRSTYMIDLKERSALDYLATMHLGGIEQK